MKSLGKAYLWAKMQMKRRWSIGDIADFVLSCAFIVLLTLRPFEKDVDFFSHGTLAMVGAALYLKWSEKLKRLLSAESPKDRSWRERKATLAEVIEQAPRLHSGPRKKSSDRSRGAVASMPETIHTLRAAILACVVSSVAELLGESPDVFCASLLTFPGSMEEGREPVEMVVAARSSRMRPTGITYRCDDNLMAWRAIQINNVMVVGEVKDSENFPEPKRYRSLVAVPVTIGERALGTLSIDSLNPHQFVNRADDLAYLLRPYISILVYTFSDDSVSVRCSYHRTQAQPASHGDARPALEG